MKHGAMTKTRRHGYRLSRASRSGYSLAEMALAVMAVSLFLGGMMWSVVQGIQLTVKADQRTIALALAQAKMSQLMNNPNLSATKTEYRKMQSAGIYTDYRWKVKVTQDKVDLAEVSQSGRIAPAVDDKLPSSVQNNTTQKESLGTSKTTETGGEIEILRVTVSIKPPESTGADWVYRVTTFQPLKKTRQASEE